MAVADTAPSTKWEVPAIESKADEANCHDVQVAANPTRRRAHKKALLSTRVQKKARLSIAMPYQGLSSNTKTTKEGFTPRDSCCLVEESRQRVVYGGKTFEKGHCYKYCDVKNGSKSVVVGIREFLSDTCARCSLIVPFSETFLGVKEKGVSFEPTYQLTPYVQVIDGLPPLLLENFREAECSKLPEWIYEPKNEGNCYNFAYYLDRKPLRHGIRNQINFLELFSGIGGMHQGE